MGLRPVRQDTFTLTLSVDGVPWGEFDKKTGGKLDSTETKYKPGSMGPPISLGGSKQTDNVTLQRLYRKERDHDRMNEFYGAVGNGKAKISWMPRDPDGNAFGDPIVWNGTVKSVEAPDQDSEQTGPALLSVEVSVSGYPVK